MLSQRLWNRSLYINMENNFQVNPIFKMLFSGQKSSFSQVRLPDLTSEMSTTGLTETSWNYKNIYLPGVKTNNQDSLRLFWNTASNDVYAFERRWSINFGRDIGYPHLCLSQSQYHSVCGISNTMFFLHFLIIYLQTLSLLPVTRFTKWLRHRKPYITRTPSNIMNTTGLFTWWNQMQKPSSI